MSLTGSIPVIHGEVLLRGKENFMEVVRIFIEGMKDQIILLGPSRI